MKMKHVLYLTIVLGLLLPMSALTVLAAEGAIPMWVQRAWLTWTGRSSGGPDAIVGYIHIHDATNDMVEDAWADAEWTLPNETKLTKSKKTNPQGIAIFSQWEAPGEYILCVKAVTKEDVGTQQWEYDPELNFDTVNNDTGCQVFMVP